MKILVLSSCYPKPLTPNHGIFVHQQMKALSKLGVEVHVIQPVGWYPPLGLHRLHPYWRTGFEQHRNTFKEFEGIRIHHPRIFSPMPSRFFREHSWDREGRQVAQFILSQEELKDADLIYAQFLIHEGYIGTVVKKHTGIPLVSIALGDDVHAWPEKHPENVTKLKLALYRSDLVLANSQRLARDAEAWVGHHQEVKVQCVYQGIDLDRFQPVDGEQMRALNKQHFHLDTGKKHLLCIATPVVLKGWIELLDTFGEMREALKNWNLVMVAPLRRSQDALDLILEAKKRHLEHQVDFLGAVDPADMPQLMQAVDAFVLPSYNEGLSNAVLEALASGLPVITTDVGGHMEAITHKENGWLIPPKDKNELKNALREVLLNVNTRNHIARKARTGAQKIGSYHQNAIKLIDQFNHAIR